jgi:hypothetical protein
MKKEGDAIKWILAGHIENKNNNKKKGSLKGVLWFVTFNPLFNSFYFMHVSAPNLKIGTYLASNRVR